jgi:hypothetical protein
MACNLNRHTTYGVSGSHRCSSQVTNAFSLIQSDRIRSPAPNVMRLPLPTRRSSMLSCCASRHPRVRRRVEPAALSASCCRRRARRVRLLILCRSASSDGAQAVVPRSADIDPMRLVRLKIPREEATGPPVHSVDEDRLSPILRCAKDGLPVLLRFEIFWSLAPRLECLHSRGRTHHQQRKSSCQNTIHDNRSDAKR